MMLIILLLLGVSSGSVLTETQTYRHKDPVTGDILTCARCPPGEHMVADCTATSETVCAKCKPEHYTALWNYLPHCLYCTTICGHNQEVERECSPVSDRVCRCKAGFYSEDGFCIPHSKCGPGKGVKTKGTSKTDTECEQCPAGFFSNTPSASEPCVEHQQCVQSGQVVLIPGSRYRDTVCGSCKDLQDSQVTLLQLFLPDSFARNKMSRNRRRTYLSRCLQRAGCLSSHSASLMDQVRAWLANAPDNQTVPDLLRGCSLNSVANKLEKKLRKIQEQAVNCGPDF